MYILLSKSVSVLNTSPSSLNWGILIICFYFNLLLKPKEISFIKGGTYTQTVVALYSERSQVHVLAPEVFAYIIFDISCDLSEPKK